MARTAPFALIIAQGWTIGWDRINDTFQLGQCIKANIPEWGCDLSPDGKYFIYWALSNRYNPQANRLASWTAISQTPYLKAVGFWPSSTGGIFLDNTTFSLANYKQAEGDQWPQGLAYVSHSEYWQQASNQDFYIRKLRGDWQIRAKCDKQHAIGIAEKKQQSWTLRQYSRHGRNPRHNGVFWQWYNAHHHLGETLGGHEWSWADFDGDRLVWAQQSKLFATEIWDGGRGDIVQLADFTHLTFKPVKAPY